LAALPGYGGGGGGGGYDGLLPVGRGGSGGSGVVLLWTADPRLIAEECAVLTVDGGRLMVFSVNGFIWVRR
jgi:hypothetical protein